jgi:hypothetical protein
VHTVSPHLPRSKNFTILLGGIIQKTRNQKEGCEVVEGSAKSSISQSSLEAYYDEELSEECIK